MNARVNRLNSRREIQPDPPCNVHDRWVLRIRMCLEDIRHVDLYVLLQWL